MTTDHIIIRVECPHCGQPVAVCANANVYDTQHVIARCDDPQDGGCAKPFAVSYSVQVDAVGTRLYDNIRLDD